MGTERIIEIRGLELKARVGVPDGERAYPQRLLFDLKFTATDQSPDLGDEISLTVDYHAVALRVEAIVEERPRKLIETLADDIAAGLLREFELSWIEITVRKFILPNAEWVSVTIRRE
ncbi:MAG: dihydroneopterin aldolase [Chthoniobacterales bacterium]